MTADERAVGTIQPGQIAVPVHNVERATAFYRDVLGLRYLCGAGQLSFFDCGGIRIMLDRPKNKEFDHPSASLIFRFLMSRPCTSLLDAGAAVVEPPEIIAARPDHDLWIFFFRDTEGNVMSLMSEAARKT